MFTNLMFTDAKIQENAHSPLKEFTFILANFTYFPLLSRKKVPFFFPFRILCTFFIIFVAENLFNHENYTDRRHRICG